MFKIKEHEDGSTRVYSIESGKLLCTVPPHKNSRLPRKVNLVESQRIQRSCLPASSTKPNLLFSTHDGLSFRSRRLIRLCARRQLQIKLERLSQETIHSWTSGKKSSSQSNSKIIISFPLCDLSYMLQCRVRLTNVLQSIKKRSSGYFVSGTSTRVPDFPRTYRSLRTNSQTKSLPGLRSKSFRHQRIVQVIPIIDLTQESSTSTGLEPETVVDNWLFKCLACGDARYYYDPLVQERSEETHEPQK